MKLQTVEKYHLVFIDGLEVNVLQQFYIFAAVYQEDESIGYR